MQLSAPFFVLIIGSFLASFGTVAAIRHFGKNWLIDIPSNRSSHAGKMTRGGGVGFIFTFVLISILTPFIYPSLESPLSSSLWPAVGLLVFVGLIDDHRSLPYQVRLFAHMSIGAFLFFRSNIPAIVTAANLNPSSRIFVMLACILAIALIINIYNFMDGLDGQLAGVSLVQFITIGLFLDQGMWFLFAAALAGYLYWNWEPAQIFMGDSGSTFLGALFVIALIQPQKSIIQTWPLLIVALPILSDAIVTLCARILRGENIFTPHRHHLYQRLYKRGFSHAQVSVSYILVTALSAAPLFYFFQ